MSLWWHDGATVTIDRALGLQRNTSSDNVGGEGAHVEGESLRHLGHNDGSSGDFYEFDVYVPLLLSRALPSTRSAGPIRRLFVCPLLLGHSDRTAH